MHILGRAARNLLVSRMRAHSQQRGDCPLGVGGEWVETLWAEVLLASLWHGGGGPTRFRVLKCSIIPHLLVSVITRKLRLKKVYEIEISRRPGAAGSGSAVSSVRGAASLDKFLKPQDETFSSQKNDTIIKNDGICCMNGCCSLNSSLASQTAKFGMLSKLYCTLRCRYCTVLYSILQSEQPL